MTHPPVFTSYVLPISGTDFVRYIAFYSVLAEHGIIPQRIYCASGGCLASYLAMMSSFTKQIEHWDITSTMLIEKTTPFKFRTMTYILNGYLYRRPDLNEFIKEAFIPAKMRDVEIISGYYRSEEKKVVISTNLSEMNSSLSQIDSSRLAKWDIQFTYGPSDMNDLMKYTHDVIRRTSNIPYLLESDDRDSIDFGVIAPSPRLLLNVDPHQSIYFSPIDITADYSTSLMNSIFHRMILNDIIMIENQFDTRKDFDDLIKAFEYIHTKVKYVLIIYTKSDIVIPITNFGKKQIQTSIIHAKSLLRYTVFVK